MIEGEWLKYLQDEFSKDYYKRLYETVNNAYANQTVYPPANELFSALELTPYESVKCVILGQDPYHGKGQAHGLAFSVKPECPIPPSLQNIYTEIRREYRIPDIDFTNKELSQRYYKELIGVAEFSVDFIQNGLGGVLESEFNGVHASDIASEIFGGEKAWNEAYNFMFNMQKIGTNNLKDAHYDKTR